MMHFRKVNLHSCDLSGVL